MRGHLPNLKLDVNLLWCPRYHKKVPHRLCKTCSFNLSRTKQDMCTYEHSICNPQEEYVLKPSLLLQ